MRELIAYWQLDRLCITFVNVALISYARVECDVNYTIKASVPVTVHFPAELIVRSQFVGFGDDLLFPIILGSILVGFVFLVAELVDYICHSTPECC
ncbi:uncharacterized protein LOC136036889 isoform X2 [Artemia franciscana]|uniref:uncharacterized protein LOC136036889 isoform X2 n=1 Tax=Artemia franciscana TaxID=6661 RepID=UPI0032DA2B1E